MTKSAETIFACSSGVGRAGIAVWRISGPDAGAVLDRLIGPRPAPRRAVHRTIIDPDGEPIDDGLCLWFPGPQSATGEDVAEVHLHGSIAVGDAFSRILSQYGLIPAAPGAFTLKAFMNGRMDLLAVEGLGDLLDAETDIQRQQALSVGQGKSRTQIKKWRESLIAALGVLDAAVDFPDEEDIPADIAHRAVPLLAEVRAEMADHLATAARGQKLIDGLDLAIIGPPNAGKSSLMNRLMGEERAIVSDIAGTTRDVVTGRINIAGRVVNVLDTAGIRDHTQDTIEREGIKRSRAAAEAADIIVVLHDATENSTPSPLPAVMADGAVIEVTNKVDLHPSDSDRLALSLKTGEGWDEFLRSVEASVRHQATPSLFPRARQQLLLARAVEDIDRLLQGADQADSAMMEPELFAEDLRGALSQLDQLVGQVTTEDVLGSIFSSFCVGK